MTDQTGKEWSDERIEARCDALTPGEADMGEMEYWNCLRDIGLRVGIEIRNDLQSTIDALRGELAEAKATLNAIAEFQQMMGMEGDEIDDLRAQLASQTAQVAITLDAATVEALQLAIAMGNEYCSVYHDHHGGATGDCHDLSPLRRLLAQVTGG